MKKIFITMFVLGLVLFGCLEDGTSLSDSNNKSVLPPNLTGKNFSDLQALQVPVVCTIVDSYNNPDNQLFNFTDSLYILGNKSKVITHNIVTNVNYVTNKTTFTDYGNTITILESVVYVDFNDNGPMLLLNATTHGQCQGMKTIISKAELYNTTNSHEIKNCSISQFDESFFKLLSKNYCTREEMTNAIFN